MDLDEYFDAVEQLARKSLDSNTSPQDVITTPGQNSVLVTDCIKYRESLLTDQEENDLTGYLAFGLFSGQARRPRLAAFAFCLDVQRAADLRAVRSQCEPYNKKQALFVGAPQLFNKIRTKQTNNRPDWELIELDAVQSISGTEIYCVGQGFAKLTPYLSPGIVNWALVHHRSSPKFIRLDPHQYYQSLPNQSLAEATVVPANPKWIPNFSLEIGNKDFAAYSLTDRPYAEAPTEFWDYHVRRLRKLEVHVKRRQHTYLSMMIEELPAPDDANGFMVARCIHLDTSSPVGTPLDQVKIDHLDLALNVYCGDDRNKRFETTLQRGKAQDATFRTHIFRIENIPFVTLFSFCEMFIQSRTLLGEWLNELASGSGTPFR